MDSRLTEALNAFRTRYPGQESAHKRIEGWLLDHAPTEKRAAKALAAIPKLDLHLELEKLSTTTPSTSSTPPRIDAFAFRRMTDAITSQEGLASDLAEQAMLVWLKAYKIEAPDATALRGPIDTSQIAAQIEASKVLHVSMKDLSFISQVRIEGLTTRAHNDLLVNVWLSGVDSSSPLKSTTWSQTIERVRGKQVVILDNIHAAVAQKALHELRAPMLGRWWIEVKTKEEVLLRSFQEVEALPPRTWPMGRVPTPALAAFVLREDAVVAELVGEASSRISEDSDARPAAVKALAALQSLLADLQIAIRSGTTTALVNPPRTVFATGEASAIEMQLMLAACLEHGGMSPMLLWTSTGPALGVWTTEDQRPALLETDDPELVQRIADAGMLVLVPIGDHVLRLREPAEKTAFAALDLASARVRGVLPLESMVLEAGTAAAATSDNPERQKLLDRAALNAKRSGMLLPGAWGARLGRRPDAAGGGGGADSTPPRLQHWKRRLLDLTLNNPLLNAKVRVTSLPLMVHDCAGLEDSLASGSVFRLEPRPSAPNPGQPKPDVTPQMTHDAASTGSIFVDLTDKRLVTQSKNAQRAFKGALEEGGVHTLFLTLGSLEWESRRAPILLVPVLIRRTKAGYYEIKKADAETELNAALIEFLRREHGVQVAGVDPLPADHSGIDVPAVFAAIKKALQSSPTTASWTVHEEAQMGILAFSGFRMWRDLDHQSSDLLRHALVRRLAVGVEGEDEKSGSQRIDAEFADPATLDDRWPARDVLCPLEADGSQLTAILAACEGKSFVLEGPPGTGKSQTIANLIAQCLSAGKTVLFVSQKRAALEVVESRLAAIGLSPFLLELHSKKASKPEFIQQLKVAAEFRAQKPPRDWNVEADVLATSRAELNSVVRALHAQRDPGMSVYQAIADAEARTAGQDRLTLEIGTHIDLTDRAFEKTWITDAKANVGDLVLSFERLGQGWEDLESVRATEWPKAKREELEAELRAIEAAAPSLEEACRGLSRWMPDLAEASSDDLELADVVLAQIETSPRPRLQLLWDDGGNKEVEPWIQRVHRAREKAKALGLTWSPELLRETLEPRIRSMKQWMGVFLLGWIMLFFQRWFFKTFVVKSAEVPPNQRLVEDAETFAKLQQECDAIVSEQIEIGKRIGDLEMDEWGLPVVDEAEVKKLLAFAATFRKRTTRFPNVLELAAEGAPTESAVPMKQFRASFTKWNDVKRIATTSLDLAGGFSKPTEKGHIAGTVKRAQTILSRTALLRDWGAHRRNRDACVALGLGKLVRAIEKKEVAADNAVEAFSNTWLTWWIDQRVASDKALASFDGLKQRAREERFAQVDRTTRELARHEILSRIAARQPRLDSGAPPTSQAGILLRQFGRRSGFASPRQLFSECAGLIRQLKPCVLMSPQSVAQYLDPSQPPFDIVVFDEASQVPTHEAIGAIARGRHVVVVGDSKQLPPTSFFLGGGSKDDAADSADGTGGDEVLAELDSILEECSASGLPALRLGWHYRSRHPSLISFSNTRYYGSRLQVLPSAEARPANLGISVTHVKGAIYDRGNTATNAGEARALVAELVRRLRDPNENQRSLGVVTFSRSQQALVEDLLEEARTQYPEIEPFFDPERAEPLIVKNLENIQGDERDVVLFSIGYGPDAKGKMTANMGPLGQLGGERRLNVAITRAREQLMVFVSFEPKQLDLSSSSAQGLHDLKAFLETASSWENVVVGNASGGAAEPDAAEIALKRALASRLEEAGHTIDLDVGSSHYRVDIAVRDRRDPNKYVFGIEIDGPRYALTDTARDRERLRWEVLAGLGWRMHRMRALDWYEDRDAVVSLTLKAIEEAETALPLTTQVSQIITPLPPPPDDALTVPPSPVDAPVSERSVKLFYRIAKPASHTGNIRWESVQTADVVASIVEQEGPISERLLARRVGDAWGMKRAPSMTGHVASVLARIGDDKRPIIRDGFFWPTSIVGDGDAWRSYRVPDPAEPDTRRDAEDIPIEELANCASDLLTRYGTMPHEDLARAVAKRFGFRGLTKVVAQRVDLGIAHASQRDPHATSVTSVQNAHVVVAK